MNYDDLTREQKLRIYRIGNEGVQNLTDPEFKIFETMRQMLKDKEFPFNEPKKFAEGGVVGSSGVIRIEIDLGGGSGDDYDMSDDYCPIATQDSEVNAENQQVAVDDYSYGRATKTWEDKNAKCGTCVYYDKSEKMLDCIGEDDAGYCTKLNFVCGDDAVCNLWELGVPKSEMNPSDDGNSRDIF